MSLEYESGNIKVEAMQFLRGKWHELQVFTKKSVFRMKPPKCIHARATCQLTSYDGSREREHTVMETDYIIKFPNNEWSSCSATIFKQLYNKIEEK